MNEASAYIKRWQKTQKDLLKEGSDCAYLYMHLEADTDEPFYIGMGDTSVRPWSNGSRSKKHKARANKHGKRVHVEAVPNMTFDNALWWEVRWIKAFRDAGYDLVNLTDGGDGAKGFKHTAEAIQKMSEIQQERVRSENYVAPLHLPGVKEKHLEATQSEDFKEKQRARISVEGNILDRPGAKEAHWEATHSEEWSKIQRERLLRDNPMLRLEARKKHAEVIKSSEYKKRRLETAPKGGAHYSKKSAEAIASQILVGKKLAESLTTELRSENGKKGWEKRKKRYQYWGA